MMFEDRELPDLERKALRETISHSATKRKGYRKVGIHVQLDKRRTVLSRIRRKVATGAEGDEPAEAQALAEPTPPTRSRFPFIQGDLRFRRRTEDVDYESNAVVLCLMDTSGSMDTMKKYLARSFFFLLYQFVRTRYQNVELVFVGHHTEAKEVTEEEFFHKGESGGTMISSGYRKALEIIDERFHPDLWNIYAFHCSDGDNFDSDNAATIETAQKLCEICNLDGYGEIKPLGSHYYESSMLERFRKVGADNFHSVLIERREDVWAAFRQVLAKDRAEAIG
jgi:sporulation protein YhbH